MEMTQLELSTSVVSVIVCFILILFPHVFVIFLSTFYAFIDVCVFTDKSNTNQRGLSTRSLLKSLNRLMSFLSFWMPVILLAQIVPSVW